MQKLSFLVIGILFSLQTFAQMRLGVFAGIANYQGDIVDKLYQKPKGAFGLTLGYQLSGRINLRAGLTFAKVGGADSLSEQPDLRMRNLSFESPITEFSLVGEFNTFDISQKSWTPYVFAGLSIYHFNPYTFDGNGNKVFLQPLSTEGQGLPGYPDNKPYALTQIALPFGGGIKYNINDNLRIALELSMHKLFTDYFDDVSGNYADPVDLLANKGQQAYDLSYRGDEVPGGDPNYPAKGITRGSPKYKDYFYFTGVHLSFLLPQGDGGGFAKSNGRNRRYGCPTTF
jgi:hypothetical protein